MAIFITFLHQIKTEQQVFVVILYNKPTSVLLNNVYLNSFVTCSFDSYECIQPTSSYHFFQKGKICSVMQYSHTFAHACM